MPTLKKKRVLAAGLTVLIVWPALHFALARTAGINPWRFAGWAMYAVYHPREVRMALVRCDGGVPLRCLEPIRVADLSATQKMKLLRFSRERSAWGTLRSPDDIANELAPQLRGSLVLRISIADSRLDPATNMIRRTVEDFDYASEGSGRLRRR